MLSKEKKTFLKKTFFFLKEEKCFFLRNSFIFFYQLLFYYTEEVTKTASAIWGSPDGSLVLYVQYDDTAVSELKFPRISEGIGGTGASRTGFMLPAINNTLHTVFPDHITIRYPTVRKFPSGC